jgi:hypothetical protein
LAIILSWGWKFALLRRLSITGWANYTKKAEKEIDKKKVEKMNACCKILMFSTIIRFEVGKKFLL